MVVVRLYRPVSENRTEAAMTVTTTQLPDELQQKVEEIAREQERKPSEVVEDVRRYVAFRRLEQLAEKGEKRARALGIREEDVPGLVQELRRENRDRGR
jgi:predicted transcriptional regulator